jgi:putative Mg2+ transporter-C (MgtC) family protein
MWDQFNPAGQGMVQLAELTLAFVLSALVGLEREIRQKSAGLRTYTLVGVSAALFMLISKHGFDNVLVANRVVLDPSRVAAQIVSGIGFIGGGVIFMRRDIVRGLTTAASVWLTAALGMACGAGLPVLAIATVLGHFVIMFVFPKLARYLPRERRMTTTIRLAYQDGAGCLAAILEVCTQLRFAIDHVDVHRGNQETQQDQADLEGVEAAYGGDLLAVLRMRLRGKRPIADLVARLSELRGVASVGTIGDEADLD